MIPCAYCEKPCQPTREHIVPRWYSLTPGESETFNARQPITHLKGDLMIKDVCSTCNGGVLSQLDGYGKKLYDNYFSVSVGLGDVVEVTFDIHQLTRWLLKLSFNSGMANGTDMQVLAQYRDVISGRQPIGGNVFLSCHLIGPSIVDDQQKLIRPPVFEYSSGEAVAKAQEINGEFVVFKGSTALKISKKSDGYRKLREQLIQDGKLVGDSDGNLLMFTEDVVFNSPSAAAATVNAGNMNERTAWKIAATRQTYEDWHQAQLPQDSVDE